MKATLLAIFFALALGGCRAATMAAAAGAGYLQGRSGAPPPQTVRVEQQPVSCTATTMSIYTTIDCR